jgi:hypothetical protein
MGSIMTVQNTRQVAEPDGKRRLLIGLCASDRAVDGPGKEGIRQWKDELAAKMEEELVAELDVGRTGWLPCWRTGTEEDELASELAGVL